MFPDKDQIADEFLLTRYERFEFVRIATHILFIADSVRQHLNNNNTEYSIFPLDSKREILNWEVKLEFILDRSSKRLVDASVAYASRIIEHMAPTWEVAGFGTIIINPIQAFYDVCIKEN
jgi:hypothetical protein